MRKGFQWYDLVALALFVYLFVLQLMAIWPFTVDDMYIPLRYARNWVQGGGLLWNIHEPPVEGYSNFSFVLLGALSIALNIDPVVILKSAGVIGLFFSCVFLYLISRFWFDKRQALIPCFGLLLYKGQIIWSVSGLETSVYQALITAAVYFIFKGLGYEFFPNPRSKARPFCFLWAGFVLSIAGLTRPEAPALMFLFFLLICFDRPKPYETVFIRGLVLFILPLVSIYLPYFIWRWWHYGYFFPNPIYCKGLSQNDVFNLDWEYLKLVMPFLVLALPAYWKTCDFRYLYLWVPSIIYLLMLSHSDPIVAFYNRLFFPAFILLLPLTLQGMSQLVLLYSKERNSLYFFTLYIGVVIFAVFFIPKMSLSDYRLFTKNPIAGEQLRREVIHWLSKVPDSESVVLADSGMIPFYSKLRFLDSYCLNNREMAHYPKTQMYELFCQKMIAEKPKFIILTSLIENGEVIYTPSDACLKKYMDSQNVYRLSKEFSTINPNSMYRYELFTNL